MAGNWHRVDYDWQTEDESGGIFMSEQFLTLMADLDEKSQLHMAKWYEVLQKEGFIGTQTPGLPYHISLASYPLEKEKEAAEQVVKAASQFAPFALHFSHIGLFAGGKVVFAAPERTTALDELQKACDLFPNPNYPWTPHTTLILDEPDVICRALPLAIKSFRPFMGTVTRLHLCAFWPTREIVSVELKGDR